MFNDTVAAMKNFCGLDMWLLLTACGDSGAEPRLFGADAPTPDCTLLAGGAP